MVLRRPLRRGGLQGTRRVGKTFWRVNAIASERARMSVHPAQRADRHLRWQQRRGAVRRLTAAWLLDGPGYNWLRFAIDVVMLALSVGAAIVGAHAAGVSLDGAYVLYAFPVVVLVLLFARGMYKRRLRISILDGVRPVVSAISVAAMICLSAVVFFDATARPSGLIARAWLFAAVYVGAGRGLLSLSQRRARPPGPLGPRAPIVGAGQS